MRDALGAAWPFLSDPGRVVQKDLDIAEYTDPRPDDPVHVRPRTRAPHLLDVQRPLVLGAARRMEDLRRDLREVTRTIRPDWDLGMPGLREKWGQGQRDDDFWPYGRSMREVLAAREA